MVKQSSIKRPLIALLVMLVFYAGFIAILIGIGALAKAIAVRAPLLSAFIAFFFMFVFPWVGFILGIFPQFAVGECYGIYSLKPFRIFSWITIPLVSIGSIIAMLNSCTYLNESLGTTWIWATECFTFAVFAITSILFTRSNLKSCYCDYCKLTNIMQFERTRPGESVYGYKYQEHSGRTEEARVCRHGTSTGTTIQYRTGPYQENLGLHKFSTEYNIYVCEICGNRKVETERKETKV